MLSPVLVLCRDVAFLTKPPQSEAVRAHRAAQHAAAQAAPSLSLLSIPWEQQPHKAITTRGQAVPANSDAEGKATPKDYCEGETSNPTWGLIIQLSPPPSPPLKTCVKLNTAVQHCSSLLLFNQHRWRAAKNFHQAPELVLLSCAWPWLTPREQGEDGVGVEQYHFADRRAELLPNSLSSEQGKKSCLQVQVCGNAAGIMAYNGISKWGPSWASHPINSSPPSSLWSQAVS